MAVHQLLKTEEMMEKLEKCDTIVVSTSKYRVVWSHASMLNTFCATNYQQAMDDSEVLLPYLLRSSRSHYLLLVR
eukprot:scaffold310610_cov35-Attheya_sp.AAC.1